MKNTYFTLKIISLLIFISPFFSYCDNTNYTKYYLEVDINKGITSDGLIIECSRCMRRYKINPNEKPDEEVLKIYFSNIEIGKVTNKSNKQNNLIKKNNDIFPNEQLCLYGTVVQENILFCLILDLRTGYFINKILSSSNPLKKGDFIIYTPVDLPAGKYEYRLYVQSILIKTFSFDIK